MPHGQSGLIEIAENASDDDVTASNNDDEHGQRTTHESGIIAVNSDSSFMNSDTLSINSETMTADSRTLSINSRSHQGRSRSSSLESFEPESVNVTTNAIVHRENS